MVLFVINRPKAQLPYRPSTVATGHSASSKSADCQLSGRLGMPSRAVGVDFDARAVVQFDQDMGDQSFIADGGRGYASTYFAGQKQFAEIGRAGFFQASGRLLACRARWPLTYNVKPPSALMSAVALRTRIRREVQNCIGRPWSSWRRQGGNPRGVGQRRFCRNEPGQIGSDPSAFPLRCRRQ